MIKVYFTKNNNKWSSDKLAEMITGMPADIRNKISAYKDWQERQSRILGKWMLLKMFEHYKLDLTLADLRYTEFNKPYFTPKPPKGGLNTMESLAVKIPFRGFGGNKNFNFSISHSADMVICAGSLNADIGVDIEKMGSIELADYREQLTSNEWEYIQRSTDPQNTLYEIWTKKEALLKALGRGVDIDLDTLDVSADTITYHRKQYWFYSLPVGEGYIAHIATSAPSDSGSISFEKLSGPL